MLQKEIENIKKDFTSLLSKHEAESTEKKHPSDNHADMKV